MFFKKEIKNPSLLSTLKQSLIYILGAVLIVFIIIAVSPVVMFCCPFVFVYMMFKIYLRYKLKINNNKTTNSNNNLYYDIHNQIKKRNEELYDSNGNFKIIKK